MHKKNINGGIVVSKRVFCRHAKDLILEFEPKNVEGRWKSEGTRARAHTQYTYSYVFFSVCILMFIKCSNIHIYTFHIFCV